MVLIMVRLDTGELTNALWAGSKLALATKGVTKTSLVNIVGLCLTKAIRNLFLAKSSADTANFRKATRLS